MSAKNLANSLLECDEIILKVDFLELICKILPAENVAKECID